MKTLFFVFFSLLYTGLLQAQNAADSVKKVNPAVNADDPSQFFTRIEFYNELQRYNKNDFYLNATVLRNIIKIGKRFTTRVDLPYVHNSINTQGKYKSSGIGDISFRVLGYKFLETRKSAFTASVEVSLNTAASPILGTGKNLLIPVITYSKVIPKNKMIISLVLQQANSISGDKDRATISFSKLQFIMLKTIFKRAWVVVAPEWFLDYVNGGLSMNINSRLAYAPTPRINIWITPAAGVFGDFIGRYDWKVDVGGRYFLFRSMNFKNKK